ncbi:hypothetical protein M9458_056935, partial [Cirrhinus mrigala]
TPRGRSSMSSKGNVSGYVCNLGSLRRERDTASSRLGAMLQDVSFRRRSGRPALPVSFYTVVALVVTHRQRRVAPGVTS